MNNAARHRLVLNMVCLGCMLYLLSGCNSPAANRMEHASSPYLREHADNPVDWYEWGDEALAKAKNENKPLLISIGYAACHWCHEMERESFMDTAVARIMNERFVCIKVDREERPDLDQVYSDACQLLTGSSGWPLNAFALPNGKPFFAGTYYNKASWTNLLNRIADTYVRSPNKVKLQADGLAMGLQQPFLSMPVDSLDRSMKDFYEGVRPAISEQLDLVNGGVKGAARFPSPFLISYLLQDYYSTGSEVSLRSATLTLDRIEAGGIHDQVGGGFSRYTTDSNWRTPHFEKMLYDNAQLVSVYSQAYQLTGNAAYRETAVKTASFLLEELISPAGLFYSSLNADSDGGEGNFYTWTPGELRDVLGADYPLLARYYGIDERRPAARQVLAADKGFLSFVTAERLDSTMFRRMLDRAGKQMLAVRARRKKPSVNKKILTSWNALALTAFLDLYAATGDARFNDVALRMAGVMEKHVMKIDGTLMRSPAGSEVGSVPAPHHDAMLEDYAYVSNAMIRLYQLSFNKHWLDIACKVVAKANQLFADKNSSFYYTSAAAIGESGIRSVAIADNGIPSPNAMLGRAMCYLSVYYQDDALIESSRRMLETFSRQKLPQAATAYASWYALAGLHAFGLNEVAVMGQNALSLNMTLQRQYLPLSAFMGSAGIEDLPLLEGKSVRNTSLIYVCADRTCKRPVADATSALMQIRDSRSLSTNKKD